MKTAIALLGTAVVAAAVATLVTLKAAPRGPDLPNSAVRRVGSGERPGDKTRAFTAPAPRLQMPEPELAEGTGPPRPTQTFNESELPAEETRVLKSLDGAVEREQPDPAWAAGMEQQIRNGLKARPDERITAVSCRRTICRVELEHPASLAREAFVNQLTEVMPPGLMMHLQKLDRDGRALSIIHIIREGFQPPPSL